MPLKVFHWLINIYVIKLKKKKTSNKVIEPLGFTQRLFAFVIIISKCKEN